MEIKTSQRVVVLLSFFLSGMAGLIYEISWIREASLLFGATLPAITAVTTVFFGGLALGNWRQSKRTAQSSVKTYRVLQLLIVITSIASLGLFKVSGELVSGVLPLIDNGFVLFLFRLFVITVIIGPATFLMGATWPVMIAITRDTDESSSRVALLYSVNSAGAVLGTLLTGLYLIPLIGSLASILVAAGANLLVAIIFPRFTVLAMNEKREVGSDNQSRFIYLLSFLVGFSAIGVQIIWSRFLSLVLHNTVYTYTITISTVILGIVFGSLLASKLVKKKERIASLLGAFLIATLTVLIATLYLPADLWQSIGEQETVYRVVLAAISLMFIPSLLSGAIYPILVELVRSKGGELASTAGKLSAANTVGGILGSSITGFLLLPVIGIGHSIEIFLVVYAIMAIVTVLKTGSNKKVLIGLTAPLLLLAFLHRSGSEYIEEYIIPRGYSSILISEGETATVSVFEKRGMKIMEIDRLWQGENRVNRQIMAAHIPAMMSVEKPNTVMVIGVGTGATARRFTMYGIDSLDLVDIEPAVFDAARKEFDGGWMDSSSINEIIADGRSFVRYSKREYDIISVEIGQMFRPYSAAFYTTEFYENAKERLSANGVLSQFMPIASFDDETFRRAIATFTNVFPEAQLWYNSTEFILLGFKGERGAVSSEWARQWFEPENNPVYEDLRFSYWGGKTYPLNYQLTFAAGYLVGGNNLVNLGHGREPFNDNVPELEYFASKNQENEPFVKQLSPYLSPIKDVAPFIPTDLLSESDEKRSYNLGDIFASGLYRVYTERKDIRLLEEAVKWNPHNLSVNVALLNEYLSVNAYEDAIEPYEMVRRLQDNTEELGYQLVAGLVETQKIQDAVNILLDMVNLQEDNVKAHALLAGVLTQAGRYDLALRHVLIALELDPTFAPALQNLEYLKSVMGE